MTNGELKAAMDSGEEVFHRGIVYQYISAIIYRKANLRIVMQVELFDKTRNCVVLAKPDEVVKMTTGGDSADG